MGNLTHIVALLAVLLLLCCQEGLMTSAQLQQQADSRMPIEPNSPGVLPAEVAEVHKKTAV
jgi:hypothetical protein